jgi:sugar lactone lactonase YvrE
MTSRFLVFALLLGATACSERPRTDQASDSTAQAADTTAAPGTLVATVEGLQTPESALHDEAHDLYLVSNINGGPSQADNNGFISRVRPDGTMDSLRFIAGGVGGVTLNAPKGLALRNDTIWVSDIDVVRMFNATSGAALGSISFRGLSPVFLNDVATGPDGAIYVTDSGIKIDGNNFSHPGPDRVFRIGPDRKVSVVLEGERLKMPNGITWEANRFLIAPLADTMIYSWTPGDSALQALVSGPGGYDGIETMAAGRFVVSSQDSSSILLFENGRLTPIIRDLTDPADIGIDRRRNVVLIPSLGGNRLEIRSLGGR